eukprot:4747344-Pleurochrysis_carterae.AAC.2
MTKHDPTFTCLPRSTRYVLRSEPAVDKLGRTLPSRCTEARYERSASRIASTHVWRIRDTMR